MRELPLSLHCFECCYCVSHSETSFRRLNNWNTMDLTYTGQFNRNTSAATNKKLIWLKVILLLHSFSQANLPVSQCVCRAFLLSRHISVLLLRALFGSSFTMFDETRISIFSTRAFDLVATQNIWYYLFYVRFGFESVSNRDENVLRRTQRTLSEKESWI